MKSCYSLRTESRKKLILLNSLLKSTIIRSRNTTIRPSISYLNNLKFQSATRKTFTSNRLESNLPIFPTLLWHRLWVLVQDMLHRFLWLPTFRNRIILRNYLSGQKLEWIPKIFKKRLICPFTWVFFIIFQVWCIKSNVTTNQHWNSTVDT